MNGIVFCLCHFILLWQGLDAPKPPLLFAKKVFNYLVEGFCVKHFFCLVWLLSTGCLCWCRYEDDPIIGHRLHREIRKVEVKKAKTKGSQVLPSTTYLWETVATNFDEFQDVSVSYKRLPIHLYCPFVRFFHALL